MARSVDIAARSSRRKHLTGQRKAGIGTLLGQVVESLMSADIERSSAERRHHPAKTRSSDPYSSKYDAMPITVEDRYFDVWNTKTEAETADKSIWKPPFPRETRGFQITWMETRFPIS